MESAYMSPSVLNLQPEEIDTTEKREKYVVSILGCEHVGVLCACLFAEAGFKVTCMDSNPTVVNLLNKGKAPLMNQEVESRLRALVKTGHVRATTDLKNVVSQSDVIVITTSAKIDEKKKVDYSEIENVCKQVGSDLRRGSLVIAVGIVGFGFTEGVIGKILENTSGLKVGIDFGLAYSPIQIPREQTMESLIKQELKVAASEKNSLNSASMILETITKKSTKKTLNIKTAELAVLFEAVQRDVNLALTNELAIFCEKASWDYLEIFKLLNSSSPSGVSLPTLAEENDQKETYLLLEDAENLNAKLCITPIAREANEEIFKHAVNLTQSALRDCGKTLRRARIALLGLTKTANMKTPQKIAAKTLAEILGAKGAKITLHDPYISENELTETPYPFKRSMLQALEGTDCAIILTGHDQFKRPNFRKLKVIMKMPAAIIDFEGIIEPDKVEKEGFIYRGLGRGVWKK